MNDLHEQRGQLLDWLAELTEAIAKRPICESEFPSYELTSYFRPGFPEFSSEIGDLWSLCKGEAKEQCGPQSCTTATDISVGVVFSKAVPVSHGRLNPLQGSPSLRITFKKSYFQFSITKRKVASESYF